MKELYELMIWKQPVPKGRPRFTKSGHTYTPKKTLDFENLIKAEFLKKYGFVEPTEKAIQIEIQFGFEIPKSYSKVKRQEALTIGHLKKPDLDNLAKAVLDALNGLAYKDDSQIVGLNLLKEYSALNKPYVFIDIYEFECL